VSAGAHFVHTYWCTPTGAHLLVHTYLSRLPVHTYR
jgi:hypothetical protein